MTCRLCLKEKPLLKQSHIAPNFIYKELRGEDNSIIQRNLDNASKKLIFTGYFESNILCRECDNNLLGKLELYGSSILYGGKLKGFKIINEETIEKVKWTRAIGVDYKRFKLFLLSILWRFSISKNEFYRFVSLGKHEEIIRKMILEDNPGEELDYPCCLTSYRNHPELPLQMISQPLRHRDNGGICYSVVMSGIAYTFYISKPLIPDHIQEIAINKNNELKVIHLPKDGAVNIIKKYFRFDASHL